MMCQLLKGYKQLGVTETNHFLYKYSAAYSKSLQT
jgi:hypothetical protein